jgi:hypothetical protein
MPEEIQDGKIYISIKYATAIHKCCCGCGNEVVTPLSPEDWKLIFDGVNVSLFPSIGNWGFKCKSHYLLRANRIIWLTYGTGKRSTFDDWSNNTSNTYTAKQNIWQKIRKWWNNLYKV